MDYLLPGLQEVPEALLPEDPATVRFLTALGATMRDQDGGESLDSRIPSAYTYFGQFVDHDIVRLPAIGNLSDPQLAPMTLADVQSLIGNGRSAPLDLDSLYTHPAPRDNVNINMMTLGTLAASGPRPQGVALDDLQDLPRTNGAAQIGDPRNAENPIIAQLHVAFLRAHNRLVEREGTFDEARRQLLQHYHWIVLHDFLPRITDPDIVAAALEQPSFHDEQGREFFLPFEFTTAYRFAHSMVRNVYDYNSVFPQATLGQLFALTNAGTLPVRGIIQWQNFAGDQARNMARCLDTRLVEPLFELPNLPGATLHGEIRLAVLDLRRGYLLRMPSGQAVAEAMGFQPLTAADIEAAAASREQLEVLRESGFSGRTPLWFYILAEATHNRNANGKDHLGPLGSTLVAKTLIGLVRESEYSILNEPGWSPTLGQEGVGEKRPFGLPDLLQFAGVLP
jgi:hypothetical protein